MEHLEVLSLRDADVGVARGVIARAIYTDDLNLRQYPDAEVRARCGPMLFESLVRYDLLFGQVDYLEGFAAVASWIRPGEVENVRETRGGGPRIQIVRSAKWGC